MTMQYPTEIIGVSTPLVKEAEAIATGVQETLVTVDGKGYCDLIVFDAAAAAHADDSRIIIIVDDVEILETNPSQLNYYGCNLTTPLYTLTNYNADGACTIIISKKYDFRRKFTIDAVNTAGNATVSVWAYPTLM